MNLSMNDIIGKSTQILIEYGPKLVGAIIVWVIGSIVIKTISKAFVRVLEKREMDDSLKPFLKSIVSILLKILLLFLYAEKIKVSLISQAEQKTATL